MMLLVGVAVGLRPSEPVNNLALAFALVLGFCSSVLSFAARFRFRPGGSGLRRVPRDACCGRSSGVLEACEQTPASARAKRERRRRSRSSQSIRAAARRWRTSSARGACARR
jgi:hypothetical protein